MFLADSQQPYGKLITDSFRAFKPLWRKLLIIFIVQAVVLGLLTPFITSQSYSEMKEIIVEKSKTGDVDIIVLSDFIHKNLGVIILHLFISSLVYLYFSIALFNRGDGVLTDDAEKIASAWKQGLKRYLRVLGYIVMVGIIFGAIFLGTALLSVIFSLISPWLVLILLILASIATIVVAIRLYYSYMLVASRQLGIFDAIPQSFKLSKGYFWRLLGMLVIVLIIPSILFAFAAKFFTLVLPAGTFADIVDMGILLIQDFVLVTLTISSGYVFLNDSIHHHNANVIRSTET